MTILAARRVLPPDLTTPAKASKPFMKLTGPLAMPPPDILSFEPRMGDRLTPAPEPYLKSMRLGLGEVHDRAHRVLDGVDEARRALGSRLDADVEPDGAVERHLLVQEQVRQLRLEGREVLVRGEVVLRGRPGGDGVHDTVDELADAVLALRRADVAAEVLADDDVGGQLAPEGGDLDVVLLEDGLAGLVGDARVAALPGDLVVGVDARRGPAALEGQAAWRPRR